MTRDLLTSFLSRGSGSVAQLLINFVIGNFYGAAAVGIYYSFVSWSAVFATVYGMGLPTLVLREVAAAGQNSDTDPVRGLLSWASRSILLASVIFISGAFALRFLLVDTGLGGHALDYVICLSAAFAAFQAQWKLVVEHQKGLGNVSRAMFLEFGLVPYLFLLALGLLTLSGTMLDPMQLILVYAVLGSLTVLPFILRPAIGRGQSASYLREFRRSIGPFWAVSLVNNLMVAAPYVLMTLVLAPADIGKFAIAHRLVGVSATLGQVVSSYFSPIFVRERDGAAARTTFLRARLTLIAYCVPLLLLYAVLDDFILSLFGPEFATEATKTAFAILIVARLLVSGLGASEAFLCMSGYERFEYYYACVSLLVFGVLSIWLVGPYGMLGVAIAFGTASVCRAAMSYLKARNVLSHAS